MRCAGVALMRVVRPRSLAEALDLRAAHPAATVLAGGTDVMVAMESRTLQPTTVIDLWGCPEFRGQEAVPEGHRFGAGFTCTDVMRFADSPPLLAAAAATVGAVQIQNRATLGGNICNASPAGDTLPVWLALDAEFEVASVRGHRRVPAASFWQGYKKIDLQPDELLVAVIVPTCVGQVHFRKVGTRLAQSISKVVFAGRHDAGRAARLAFGSVGPVPLRCRRAEAALVAAAPVEEVVRLVREEIAPLDDIRSTAHYRRQVAGAVVARWLGSLPRG